MAVSAVMWLFLLFIPVLVAHSPYRLPRNFVPEHYMVHLNLPAPNQEPEPTNYGGFVNIKARCLKSTKTISLHTSGMTFDNVTVFKNQSESVQVTSVSENNENQAITLALGESILPNEYVSIHINYNASFGCIDGSMENGTRSRIWYRGLYMRTWTNGTKLMISHSQPTCARSILPCFDEPSLKATFAVTIEHPEQFKALTNAEAVSVEKTGNRQITRFANTPRMSSYLFTVGLVNLSSPALSYANDTRNGVTYGFYVRGDVESWKYYTALFMDYFEDYFGIKYSLKKLDQIQSNRGGGMENWGLITYPTKNSRIARRFTIQLIIHELAHLWFGNLVTAAWWDDLWLNEAFASYFAITVSDHFKDELSQFGNDSSPVMKQMTSSLRLDNQFGYVLYGRKFELGQLYFLLNADNSYVKGSPILRMLNFVLGEDVFKNSLRIYLNAHQYGNADRFDFYKAVSEAIRQGKLDVPMPGTVDEFLDPWITQPFHPFVTTRLGNGGYEITQQCMNDSSLAWHVPLWYHWNNTEDGRLSGMEFTWLLAVNSTPLVLKPPTPKHTICLNPEIRAFIEADPRCDVSLT